MLSCGVWLRLGWATSVTAVAQTIVLHGHRFLVSFPNQFPPHLRMQEALEVILSTASVHETEANTLSEALRES